MKSMNALILGLMVLLASTSSCLGADDIDSSKLIVSGTGVASSQPYQVIVTLGVQTSDASAATALGDNNKLMNDVVEALKDAGVAEEDIQTSRFNIYPQREWIDGEYSDVITFEVSNQVTVTQDLSEEIDVGDLIDAAVNSGANTVESIVFRLEDSSDLQEVALKNAVEDAQSKALVISEAADVKLGRILNISVTPSVTPVVYSKAFGAETALLSSSTPIMPGELETSASVTITYQIE